jgi:hypothetical protein
MKRATLLAVVACICVACGSGTSRPPQATHRATFVKGVDNPWFPLEPGTVLVYRGVKDGDGGRDVVTVTRKTKLVDGVHCTVADDKLYVKGHLVERTSDWYAQDTRGNVWYFGEDTAELDESGRVTTREGSWQSGVDGARAGMLIPAQPKVGQTFLQEYYKGHAEDHSRVLSLAASIRVPYVESRQALLTKEWTPLEPDVIDHKVYVRGVGLVKEETIKGGNERFVLVAVLHR